MPGAAGSSADDDSDFPGSDPGGAAGGEQTAGTTGDASGQAGGDAEPGFGDGNGGESLPDLSDEPSLEGAAGGRGASAGQSGTGATAGGAYSTGNNPGGQPGSGSTGGYGQTGSSGTFSRPGGVGQGPLTPAEQVAILDAQLEQGTGDFDAMILEAEAEQRRSSREQAPVKSSSAGEGGAVSTGDSPYEGGTASAGGYGGGIGGPTGGSGVPQNTAKYPPPTDIPSGNDDDVVARQLREAAMREPDPAVREKLWDEYRKYKGID
jgi:hypothetical protein